MNSRLIVLVVALGLCIAGCSQEPDIKTGKEAFNWVKEVQIDDDMPRRPLWQLVQVDKALASEIESLNIQVEKLRIEVAELKKNNKQ